MEGETQAGETQQGLSYTKLPGTYRLQNGEGYCITKGSRTYAVPQICKKTPNEYFEIYQTSDGRYNLCNPGTNDCMSSWLQKYAGFAATDLTIGRWIALGGGKVGFAGKTGILTRSASEGLLKLSGDQSSPDRIWTLLSN